MAKKEQARASLAIEEGTLAKVDFSNLTVQINKKISLPKERDKWNKISIVAKMPSDGQAFDLEGQEVLLSSQNFQGYVSALEMNEIPKENTVVRVFNHTNYALIFEIAKEYGDTIVFLSEASQEFMAATTKPIFDGIIWLTTASNTVAEEMVLFAGRVNQGVMFDTKREGKLLFALLRLLSDNNSVQHTFQIINNNFSGILNAVEAKYLEENGISYYFATRQQVYPDGLWLGKKQAFVMYYDRLVIARLRESVARIIQSGVTLSLGSISLFQHAMDSVGIRFANQLNEDITDFRAADLSQLSEDDIREGRIYLYADYSIKGEVRRVTIEVGGE